jgi:hypothetical protein
MSRIHKTATATTPCAMSGRGRTDGVRLHQRKTVGLVCNACTRGLRRWEREHPNTSAPVVSLR